VIVRRVVEGLDERLGAATFAQRSLRKIFPDHWAFMLGEIALYSFVVLVLTGTFLTFFYVASSAETTYRGPYAPLDGRTVSLAYDSVLRVSFEVRAGLVMRQIHHWTALVFVGALIIHSIRVFFTGAFRKPREINWLIGVTLMLLGMGAGFTGYSLPDDLLSGTGLRIAYSAVLAIPFLGPWIASLIFGGEFPTAEMISRLFVFHVFLLPALLAGALAAHLALIWHQKHTQFRGPGRTEDNVVGSPLWPRYALKSVGLLFAVAAVVSLMGGIFQINPVWFYGPFDATIATTPAQPDWYVGWLEGSLRLAPAFEPQLFGWRLPEPFVPGVVVPGAFFTILALWPFIERRLTGDRATHHLLDRPRDNPLRSAVGAAGIAFMSALTLAGSNDLLAYLFQISVDGMNAFMRAILVVGPVLAGGTTFLLCRELKRREVHPVRSPERIVVVRTRAGGFATRPVGTPDGSSSADALPHHAHGGGDHDDRAEQEQWRTEHQAAGGDRDSDAEDDGPR
jgi:ubiquinol-cytochrome c reductase cytochrome b subunit